MYLILIYTYTDRFYDSLIFNGLIENHYLILKFNILIDDNNPKTL